MCELQNSHPINFPCKQGGWEYRSSLHENSGAWYRIGVEWWLAVAHANQRTVQSIPSEGKMGTPGNNSKLCRDKIVQQDCMVKTTNKRQNQWRRLQGWAWRLSLKRTVPCRNTMKAPEVPIFPVLFFFLNSTFLFYGNHRRLLKIFYFWLLNQNMVSSGNGLIYLILPSQPPTWSFTSRKGPIIIWWLPI